MFDHDHAKVRNVIGVKIFFIDASDELVVAGIKVNGSNDIADLEIPWRPQRRRRP